MKDFCFKIILLINVIKFKITYLNNKIKSIYFSFLYIDEGNGKFIFKNVNNKVIIKKNKGAKFIFNGNLIIDDTFKNNNSIFISAANNSIFKLNGDFLIGAGVKVILAKAAILEIEGKLNEEISGITCDTKIMVNKEIYIGSDFLCSWNCFITDSDWHSTNNELNTSPTFIGNHVWVTSDCKILKGTKIDDNSIITTGSVTHRSSFCKNVLIGGNPAKVIKNNITWSRNL